LAGEFDMAVLEVGRRVVRREGRKLGRRFGSEGG
jgi:hypothetical protein